MVSLTLRGGHAPLGVIFCAIVLALTCGKAGAVPMCAQLDPGFCAYYPDCTEEIEFGSECQSGVRLWRCVWTCGDDVKYYGGWQNCNCSGTGSGCDCLLPGTPILMADGTVKPVEQVRPGDRVQSYDVAQAVVLESVVERVHAPYRVDHHYVINGRLRATENHPVLSDGIWTSVGALQVGDHITDHHGGEIPVFSIQRIIGEVVVYNFQVAARTYVADGVVVHNKEDCELYEQVCPGCPIGP